MEIKLENIYNARDLGGMCAYNGKKIKFHKLIRSSCLYNASQNDCNALLNEYELNNVVDFRSEKERSEKPHPINNFKNVNYYFYPCFETIIKAFSRDKNSRKLIENNNTKFTEESAAEFIETFYKWLSIEKSVCEAYKKFIDVLLNNDKGSTLWHCSLGKDRAGMASVIIEKILGVSDADILDDYLETNNHMDPTIDLNKKNAFRAFYGVRESFIESWYSSINEFYGSFDGYLKKALSLDEDKISLLRNKYLE